MTWLDGPNDLVTTDISVCTQVTCVSLFDLQF